MEFLKSALGYQRAGSVVVVTLDGTASDVFLVDDLNLRKLERGDNFTYHGATRRAPLSDSMSPQAGHGISLLFPPVP